MKKHDQQRPGGKRCGGQRFVEAQSLVGMK